MHNRCTPRQRRVLALRMQHNALKCAKVRSRSTKMRCEMHELNAPLWTECRQMLRICRKCAKMYVAKTVPVCSKNGTYPGLLVRGGLRFLLSSFIMRACTRANAAAIVTLKTSLCPLPCSRDLARCWRRPRRERHQGRAVNAATLTRLS